MSTTVTGSPPRGQPASHRGGARGHAAPRVRRGLRLPRASSTPGKLAVCVLLFQVQRWLSRRTHRTVNVGLFLASAVAVAALVWLVVAIAGSRSDLLQATKHGSGSAQTLAQADITALQARGDQTLNLISRTGDANFQQDFHAAQSGLSTELGSAGAQSAAGGAGPIAAARQTATAWFAVNQRAQQIDTAADYGAETQLEIGSGPGSAGTLFGQLETDLEAAINADQAVFASNATAARTRSPAWSQASWWRPW